MKLSLYMLNFQSLSHLCKRLHKRKSLWLFLGDNWGAFYLSHLLAPVLAGLQIFYSFLVSQCCFAKYKKLIHYLSYCTRHRVMISAYVFFTVINWLFNVLRQINVGIHNLHIIHMWLRNGKVLYCLRWVFRRPLL